MGLLVYILAKGSLTSEEGVGCRGRLLLSIPANVSLTRYSRGRLLYIPAKESLTRVAGVGS
jgi:hypothetical protein